MFQSVDLPQLAIFTAASLLFVYLAVDRKALTLNGAATAVGLAFVVVYSVGPLWLLPLFIFFGSSTVIGRVFPSKTKAAGQKQGKPRDTYQVLANGLMYAVVALLGPVLFPLPPEPVDLLGLIDYFTDDVSLHEVALLSIIAVATADTWSSEVGQHFERKTYDIIRWGPVPAGLSGGISAVGTAAGFAGSLSIGLLYVLLTSGAEYPYWVTVITLTGFAGMLVDSLLGSLIQSTYASKQTGELLDGPAIDGELKSGYKCINNDVVNFLSILITFLLQYVVLVLK